MEKPPPSCLNSGYFEKALRSSENDTSITVTSCEVKRGTAAGENYGSDIYRATVKIERDGQPEERSIIIKCSLGSGAFGDLLNSSNIFEREVKMFTIALPEMERLLRKAYGKDFQPIAAKYIYSHADELSTTISLEDLKLQGFKLAEKKTLGLDKKHLLLVMNRIAKFHAVSVVINHENPEFIKDFRERSLSDETFRGMEAYFNNCVGSCAKEVETWPDLKDRFADKLHKLGAKAIDVWIDGMNRRDDEYNVLIHGDFWANNTMFKYSEKTGEVEDVRFVDFQCSRLCSPAVDLQCFLHSSASPELLENQQVLIKEYYDTFIETLNRLEHPDLKPSWSEINEQLERKSDYAVMAAIIGRCVVLADDSSAPDVEKMLTKDAGIRLSQAYKQAFRELLIIYEKNGWI